MAGGGITKYVTYNDTTDQSIWYSIPNEQGEGRHWSLLRHELIHS
jgi:hypothetical protein